IPNFLFTSDQSDQLQAYLQEHAHIVGLLELPKTAFKDDSHAKSIFILQKKGEHTSACKQPLLVQLPSLSNAQAMEDILGQMNGLQRIYRNMKSMFVICRNTIKLI